MPRASSSARGRERIRAYNQSAVLSAIHRHGRISRSELASELRLSPAAITALTAPFVEEGLVVEAELGTSTSAGRKPILLAIDYDHAYVFGVKVMNHAVVAALTNLGAEVVSVREEAIDSTDVDEVIRAVGSAVARLLEDGDVPAAKMLGVGVSLPGIVAHQEGVVRHSPLLGWNRVPFADLLRERLGLPVLIENDVNALAAAQAWFGLGRGHDSFLVVTIGRGVGLGIVVDGKVYRGPRGGAGEVGHTLCTPLRPRVMSSETTTLEARIGDAGLMAQARTLVPEPIADVGPEGLTSMAAAGNEAILDLFQDAGRCLGVALADLVNVFAPTRIVLGGEGMRNAPYFLEETQQTLRRFAFGDLGDRLEVRVDAWADDAWARGAAGVMAARLLDEATIPLHAAKVQLGSATS